MLFALIVITALAAATLIIAGYRLRRRVSAEPDGSRVKGTALLTAGALLALVFFYALGSFVLNSPSPDDYREAQALREHVEQAFDLAGDDRVIVRAHPRRTRLEIYGVPDAPLQHAITCAVAARPEARQKKPVSITFLTARDRSWLRAGETRKQPVVLKTVSVQDYRCP